MRYIKCTDRTPELIAQLVTVWERSVRATHTFLNSVAITQIKGYIPQALRTVPKLVLAVTATNQVVGFMGVAGTHLAMLFLDPAVRGKGAGRALITIGIQQYGIQTVTVNEQNAPALGFYRHLGFQTIARHAVDEQGQPYPILKMKL